MTKLFFALAVITLLGSGLSLAEESNTVADTTTNTSAPATQSVTNPEQNARTKQKNPQSNIARKTSKGTSPGNKHVCYSGNSSSMVGRPRFQR
jgi:hypothetical protein